MGYPKPKEKAGLFTFFNRIIRAPDTIKVANLSIEEVEAVRNLRDGDIISLLNGFDVFEDYFKKKGEIILASSDSKEGFLIKQATTSRKEIETKSKTQRRNKGWFKKKEKEEV